MAPVPLPRFPLPLPSVNFHQLPFSNLAFLKHLAALQSGLQAWQELVPERDEERLFQSALERVDPSTSLDVVLSKAGHIFRGEFVSELPVLLLSVFFAVGQNSRHSDLECHA